MIQSAPASFQILSSSPCTNYPTTDTVFEMLTALQTKPNYPAQQQILKPPMK
jgi:hypothetical protein